MIRRYEFKCKRCGVVKAYELEERDVERWRKGALIQRVFPQIKDREIMISGFCNDCFDVLCGGD